ncbi:MAG: peroxiredoxin family protein [Dehalococcoidia bacterium]
MADGQADSQQQQVHDATRGPVGAALSPRDRRQLRFLLGVSVLTLALLVIAGLITERSAHTSLIRPGQVAPDFSLPATNGGVLSLSDAGGRPVVLLFLPSVLCDYCQGQLRALQAALPELRAIGAVVYAVSVDTGAVQQTVAEDLHLDYPLLSEAPTAGQHPVGSAYGVYHFHQRHPGPVNANAVIVIDIAGIVQGVRVQPGQLMDTADILSFVQQALGPAGGGP